MVIDECAEIVKAFKKSFENKYPLTDDTPLESKINSGWCYCLAFLLKLKMSKYDNASDIVRSYSHWFFRIKHEGQWYYFDAYTVNGTTELMDITDNTPNALDVWTLDDVLKYLDTELVLEFININPR